jgi:hypothetical protein
LDIFPQIELRFLPLIKIPSLQILVHHKPSHVFVDEEELQIRINERLKRRKLIREMKYGIYEDDEENYSNNDKKLK